MILLLIGALANLGAQESVRGLYSIKEIKELGENDRSFKSKGVNDTLDLPFFDDFSFSKVYPHDSLWSDKNVYINNNYASDLLSLGVATFDAIDQNSGGARGKNNSQEWGNDWTGDQDQR